MKRKQMAAILLVMSMALAAGCGNTAQNEVTQMEQIENIQVVAGQSDEEIQAKEDQMDNSRTEGESSETGESNQSEESGNTTPYTWNEITLSIPNDWEGKYHVEEDDQGVSFIQTASDEKEEGMGFLCGIYKETGNMSSLNMAGATILAYTSDTTYYMVEPTDVCYYYDDEEIAAEYQQMYKSIASVGASLKINKEDAKYNPEEFIFPLSSTSRLTNECLINYSDNELRIARNEIYARYGRQFNDVWLQNYFNSCSWYEGTKAPDEFDESILNEIEKDNLATIKKAEADYKKEHPYPKLSDKSMEAKEDLDGDGIEDTIGYSFTESDEGCKAVLNISGTDFSLEDYGVYMMTPYTECFAITDIDSYYEGLEIAIMDEGPSYDPVTYFFTYDGELHYIGSVGGFPFMEIDGYNGFAFEGMVKGIKRVDLIHYCYGYSYWRYDYEGKELVDEEQIIYQLVPEAAHELYEDLPVYADMDVNSAKTTIPAQKQVFIQESDGKEWIFVKGKDGSCGYVHIVDYKIADLSKEPTEVFSDVVLAD